MWKSCCACISKQDRDPDVLELDFQHSKLTEVPPDIFTYERTLEKLDLTSNCLTDLHPSLFHCHEIRELYIGDNQLEELPAAVGSLTHLIKLDCRRNVLSTIPESIKACKSLTFLDLSVNVLQDLPEALCTLVGLEELYLTDTYLEFLPASFGRLTKLRTLEIRDNTLETLPMSMKQLSQLQKLDIGSNNLEELPEVIGTLTNLTELWADNNLIKSIPSFIGNLSKLAILDVSKNSVDEVSEDLGNCLYLDDISLSYNHISTLPDTFTKLERLVTIRADNNCLESLPENLGKLKNLQELSISSNRLAELPASIGLLRKLQALYADDNELTELCKEVGSCTSLTILSVAQNHLQRIPAEIGHLSGLKMLNLTNNMLRNLPVTILGLPRLGSLWLTDKQNKPLVTWNKEIDAETGQHVVTCFLLPQLPISATDPNLHAGEDEPRRSQRKIRFENESESEVAPPEKAVPNGGLLRAPTPYPKELRAMARNINQIRTSKGQNGGVGVLGSPNEPIYEGDAVDHDNDVSVEDRRQIHSDRYQLHLPQSSLSTTQLGNQLDDEQSGPAYANLGGGKPLPMSLSEGNFRPTPPSASPLRTPPPYHIAVQRASILRSSGGAGSGKINLPTESSATTAPSQVSPEINHPGLHFEPTEVNIESEMQDELGIPEPHQLAYMLEQQRMISNNYTENCEDEHVMTNNVPDRNANIPTSKPISVVEDYMNGNIGMAPTSAAEHEMQVSPERKKSLPSKGSRIPTRPFGDSPVKKMMTPAPIASPASRLPNPVPYDELPPPPPLVSSIPSRISSKVERSFEERFQPKKMARPVYPQEQQIGLPSVPLSKGKLESSGSRSRIPKFGASREDSSTSLISASDTSMSGTDSILSQMSDSSLISQADSLGSYTNSSASQTSMDGNISIIEKEEKHATPGKSQEVQEKSKIPRSGIPKLASSGSGRAKSGDMDRKKPWIFGTHRNARVISIEYRKTSPDRLGFSIGEFETPGAAHDGKGIYVTATEDLDLVIKVGDKILQVDGIDVDANNMGVAIVSKILANCQDTIQLLVSRQQ